LLKKGQPTVKTGQATYPLPVKQNWHFLDRCRRYNH
jgi:hypothetical protein